MNTTQRLYTIFSQALNIPIHKITDDLAYNTIPEWDSVAHMALVAELEAAFDIMLDTDDIIDMNSVGKAKEILSKHEMNF